LRLWLRRRVLRVADGARVGALRWSAVAAVVVIVVGAAGGGVAAALTTTRPPPPVRPRHHAAPKISAARAAATSASEQAAADWITAQMAPGTDVSCDAVMCADLQSAGFAAAQQLTLQAGGSLTGSTGLVVQTAVATADLGTAQLQTAAPRVLASFGTGPATVQVRVIGSTPAAFAAATRTAIASAARNGRNLARNRRLRLSNAARGQLRSGLVDPRIVHVLARLVAVYPVAVTAFGDADPGAAWPAELRSVTIAGLVHGTGRNRVSEIGSVLRVLRRLPAPYRGTVRQAAPGGVVTLTIQFAAPGPL
jgi:hypothetical protein